MMKVTFSENFKGVPSKKFAVRDTKVFIHQYSVLYISPERVDTVCTLRLYRDKNGGTFYALFWLRVWDNSKKQYFCRDSFGRAGGWGYHKASAAAGSAFISAGIELGESINGCGDDAIKEALFTIAKSACEKGRYIRDIRKGDTMGKGRYRLQLVEAFA